MPQRGTKVRCSVFKSPVGGTLGRIDQLVCQALSNGLDVSEGSLPGTGGDEVDRLVDPSQR